MRGMCTQMEEGVSVLRLRGMCTLANCDSPHASKGYCIKHYKRWKRHGDVNFVTDKTKIGEVLRAKYGNDHFDKITAKGRRIRVLTHPEYDPLRVDNSIMDIEKFAKQFIINNKGCWEWTAGKFWDGYGKLKLRHGTMRVHRWFYQIFFNISIPANLVCDHLCMNKICVNPYHLDIVTSGENTRRYHKSKLITGEI